MAMGMKQWMTFGIKTEGAEKAAKDIDGVASASKNAEKSQDGLNDSIESGTGALDKMTGGAIGAFKGVVSGVKKAVLGMKTLRGAVISTGIGALVVIVIALISYFTKTKRGAEALQVATAALGVVMDLLTDSMSGLGEVMVNVFVDPKQAILDFGKAIKDYVLDNIDKMVTGMGLLGSAIKKAFSRDFSGAMEDAKQGALSLGEGILKLNPLTAVAVNQIGYLAENVEEFTDKVMELGEAAIAYEKRSIALADAQRNLSVEFAQTREKMTELKLVSEDVNETMEKRITATEDMGALEIALADKSLSLAQEAVDIKRSQNALSESTAEDLQALADLEIALSNAQIESATKQTEILMKVNSLYKEQEAKAAEVTAKEAERVKGLLDQQEAVNDIKDAGMARELQKIEDHWAEQIRIATESNAELLGVEEAKEIQLKEVRDKYQAEAEADSEANRSKLIEGILQTAGDVLNGLSALNEAFTSLSGKELSENAARELAIQEETDGRKKYLLQKANYEILKEQYDKQKKGFENNKKIQIAEALIATYSSAVRSYNALAGIIPVGPVLGAISAAAAVTGGLAQVAMIRKSTFGGTAPSAPSYSPTPSSGGGAGAEAAGSTAPQIDLSFLGEGGTGTIQAYVIAENVTNQQQADQIVTDQTTL
tara:strand:- start:699 stop:2666 length:1968 start_codon:yes stop_codon:yes gene_type:complete